MHGTPSVGVVRFCLCIPRLSLYSIACSSFPSFTSRKSIAEIEIPSLSAQKFSPAKSSTKKFPEIFEKPGRRVSDASVETPAFTSKNDFGLFKPDKPRTLPFTLAQKERFVTCHFIGCPRCNVAGARSKDVPGLAKIIAEKK